LFGSYPDHPFSLSELSEGQITFIAYLAMMESGANRALLAMDEPETHMHPGLLASIVGYFEAASASQPVLLATHSEHVLNALSNPGASVVLCGLDSKRATTFTRPNPETLKLWMADYQGLGSVRVAGYEAHVFDGGPSLHKVAEPGA
jgi:predicted ATPase